MKADLHYKLAGQLGSFWGAHTDAATNHGIRGITQASGMHGKADTTRQLSAFLKGNEWYTKEFETIKVDGIGSLGKDFDAFASVSETRARLYTYTGDTGTWRNIEVEGGPTSGDWFAVIIRPNFFPQLVYSKQRYLVNGIDFFIVDGFMIMRMHDLSFLENFIFVRISSNISPPGNAYVIGADDAMKGTKMLVNYRKTQSADRFIKAAAQFAGMYVFEADDFVISSFAYGAATVYECARQGQLVIDYPHTPLTIGERVTAGTVVGKRIEATMALSASHINLFFNSYALVSLDYAAPVKNLYWDPNNLLTFDFAYIDGDDKPHARALLTGEVGDLNKLWDIQKSLDEKNGNHLADAIGMSNITPSVDYEFSELLFNFYGRVLMVAWAGSTFSDKLLQFIAENRPAGVCLLIAHND